MTQSPTTTAWLGPFYDDLLADVLLERHDGADLFATLEFITAQLGAEPGDRLFDQCCGIGSLSAPLIERGFDVVGVDQSSTYVDRARKAASGGDFRVADACRCVVEPACDGAFNWWTSFGYALDDAENTKMLACAFDSLRPGGRFLIDYMNVPGILRGFRPEVVLTRETPIGSVELRRISRIDPLRMTMDKTWVFTLPDGRTDQRTSCVQLYDPHRLAQLLESCGFVDIQGFGSVHGEPLELDSQRCILLGLKP